MIVEVCLGLAALPLVPSKGSTIATSRERPVPAPIALPIVRPAQILCIA